MARTSKKGREHLSVAGRQPDKVYYVGIYARLSVDSQCEACKQARKNESIETQVEIAKEFIGRQKDMAVYDVYTDIGKSGTSFERDGFECMMCDVRMRRIDCIVVKDLSRFGRNHVETGNYIEKIFPFMGVRFIAVTDNFDSMNISGQNEALGVSLKNLVNEMYAKDIAMKVKSGKRAKWEKGSYTGSVPPYGYRAEWVDGKKCLFVEEEASRIVKKIFDLFLLGKSRKEIVSWLFENCVARPAQYHKTGQVYCRDKGGLEQWPRESVKMILTNPAYMGCLVQGCTCGKDYMMRSRHDIDSGDWSVKEHTHEAIISEDIFFEAAGRFAKSSVYCNKGGFSKTVPAEDDIFADVLYCGDCGSRMKRISAVKAFNSNNRVRLYSYNCPRADRIDVLKCAEKSITLYSLAGILKEAVRQEFSLSAMRPKELADRSSREAEAMKREWEKQLAECERKVEGLANLGSEMYIKYRTGEIDEGRFRQAKEENDKCRASIQSESRAIAEKLRKIDSQTIQRNHFLRALAKGSDGSSLTAEAVRTLVERIEVYPDHRVRVVFAFKRKEILPEGGRL